MISRIFGAAGILCTLITAALAADDFPAKPLKIILPLAPGASADAVTRIFSDEVSKDLGQPIMVEPRPGGGGSIGLNTFLREPHDGYSLLFMDSSMYASLAAQAKKLGIDITKEVQGLTAFSSSPQVVATPTDRPFNSIVDLLNASVNTAEGYSYGTQFPGGPAQILGHMLVSETSAKARLVTYSGSAQYTMDLVAGRLDFGVNAYSAFKPHVASGALKVLAVATEGRLHNLPEVPTLRELGLPHTTLYFGLVTHADVDPKIVEKLNAAFVKAGQKPEIQAWLIERDILPEEMTAQAYGEALDTQAAIQREAIQAALGLTN